MNVGEVNRNGQRLLEKTGARSTTHRYATIWRMACGKCGLEYGSNSCDAHDRHCPKGHDRPAAKGEPLPPRR